MPPDYTRPLPDLPDPLAIEPRDRAYSAVVTPPGSKSLTNRAYAVAALAEGTSRLHRPLRAEDTDRLLAAFGTLGVESRWDGETVEIDGKGGRFPRGGVLDMGDGGTPTRFALAAACLAREPVVVDGSPRMRERPVAEGVEMLRTMGAHVEYLEDEGRLPVRAIPSDAFRGGAITVEPQRSSQFASAVLLIAPHLADGVDLRLRHPVTSAAYLDMTVAFLRDVGVRCEQEPTGGGRSGDRRERVGPQPVRSFDAAIEPDASSAVYWLAAAAIGPTGSTVRVPGLLETTVQPDGAFRHVLARMGATTEAGPDGTAAAAASRLVGINADMASMPDAALTLAAVAAAAAGPTRITGLHTLPSKETDRIAALANELRRLGCSVATTRESIAIDPAGRHDEPVVIATYNDHRIAMAFAILGLVRPGISIADPSCVAKSYPSFWRDFARLLV